ncbi:HindVP family restriction endonuclease [Corynebacterium sp. AOP40-9SA-29]|uniref:HindVP family restriction endonuclease n=1 Tax=Corynebacterium sp. AOP40-9SA-29 TaxID=3457677 RepID=UPI0040331DB1
MTYLYGLENANKDFTKQKSYGKNTFTNAFPLALTQYLAKEKGLPVSVIRATVGEDGHPTTEHVKIPWQDIIHTEPSNAYFQFEAGFEPYRQYTNAESIQPSDVVIFDNTTREPLHPLELKLVVVPNSGTAHRQRKEQACEIVSRPPTIEQIAFSIAYGYTSTRRYEMQTLLQQELGLPNDFEWRDEAAMIRNLPKIVRATEALIAKGIEVQRPLIMVAVWRSQGQKPLLDDHAFDTFIWTELSFVELYLNSTRKDYLDSHGDLKNGRPTKISRPARSLIWLIRSLWDYSTQRNLDFNRVKEDTGYGKQTDKAGSFTTGARDIMMSDEYLYPRVKADEIDEILSAEASEYLLPERRLDASLSLRFTLEKLRTEDEWDS